MSALAELRWSLSRMRGWTISGDVENQNDYTPLPAAAFRTDEQGCCLLFSTTLGFLPE
jgi:hypothetical protein